VADRVDPLLPTLRLPAGLVVAVLNRMMQS
jgi:hypothetical protein